MFKFDDPIYLWLLLLIPLLVLVIIASERQRYNRMKRIGDLELLRKLMPSLSNKRKRIKTGMLLVILSLLIIMLARPQMGIKTSKENRSGIEIIIAMDISNSMLANDVVPSRLEKSKMMVENLVDKFTNDKIGLIVFAGDAFVQLPITSDYVSAKMFLQSISPSLISSQGTDIARALTLAENSFTHQKGIGKAIIVITDGENHEGGALEAAKSANKNGINVFLLGVGETAGAPIPLGNGEYMKDNTGATVMSALNEEMCKSIAQAGKGVYIHVNNTNDAQEQLNAELSKLQRGETLKVIYSEYNEQFQAFCIVIILLLIIEICILERKSPAWEKVNLFKRKVR